MKEMRHATCRKCTRAPGNHLVVKRLYTAESRGCMSEHTSKGQASARLIEVEQLAIHEQEIGEGAKPRVRRPLVLVALHNRRSQA